ncbi:DUF2156 domain-containing protein [Cryobacterium algoricola]|uniref:DUF2156 domain-containing protein n=1 Tax=Cryobacterium algoricola TaxID=1259183 RepID=A0ABY2IEM6_9MICO|nr:DUF2156 domain-containing protein [Cryobacterium algoricola]TFB87326.1 DUF2156 domain-containing protein [Cryobacterium algoricola]
MKHARRYVGRYLMSMPVSLLFLCSVLVASGIAGTLFGPLSPITAQSWGADADSTIGSGRWWSIVSSLVMVDSPAQLIVVVFACLVILPQAERSLGHARLLLAMTVTGLLGVGLGVLLQWGGGRIGEWWSTDMNFAATLDPVIPIAGAALAASAFAGPLVRRRIRVWGFATLLVLALYGGTSADAYRLIAAVLGLFLGEILHERRARFNLHRSTHTETRTLVSLAVAISAIGPAISAASNGSGVLSLFGWIFGDPFPAIEDVRDACAQETVLACAHDQAFLAIHSPGSVVMLFVPLVLLLVSAYGLRQGKRAAWWLAIIMNVVLAVLSTVYVASALDQGDGSATASSIDIVEIIVWIGGPILIPVSVAVVLIVTRRNFRLVSTSRRIGQFWVVSGAALVALSASYFVVARATIDSFAPALEPGNLALGIPLRFVPVNFVLSRDVFFMSRDPLTQFVSQWMGPVFWAIVCVCLIRLLISTVVPADATMGQDTIRRFIRRGAGTYGFMATWDGNRYWFSDTTDSAVAYRLVGGVAITVSDPLCASGTERDAILEFIAYCDSQNWVVAFYSIHEEYLSYFDELGWSSVPVGVETLIDPLTLSLTGKSWQNVRTPLNRALKQGITAQWVTYTDLSSDSQTQVRAISEQWVSEKALPEMGFTLGGLEQLKDPDVRLMLAVDADHRIQAITSWLPVYRDGAPVGWTLDFMRRADDSMPGIMEFLIASAALRMQKDGLATLSLSGAPLATMPPSAGEEPGTPTPLADFMNLVSRMLEPSYGFASLFRYKSKFHPSYRSLHLAYRDPLTLPLIGRSLANAYLPDLTTAQTMELLRNTGAR